MNYIKTFRLVTENKSKSYNIYLAGPDVFKENAVEYFEYLKKLSTKYNQVGISPLDNDIDFNEIGVASKIFHGNIGIIDNCDVVIANLEPFRGPNVDDGTAFEIGYAYAKNKIVYGYMEHSDRELKDITAEYKKDKKFKIIEDFKYPRNLMIVDSIRRSGGDIFPTFEDCLQHLQSK